MVKKGELQFLRRELQFLEESGALPAGKAAEINDMYEAEKNFSYTKTLLYVGSFLIGAGILSFIASNWETIGKLAKFLIIMVLMTGSQFTGYKMESHYPKTSRSLYYLSVLVFGAGIFLVGQMFHFGGDFQDAFLWWSLGTLPLAWVLKDKWMLLGASLFVLIYMFQDSFLQGINIPYWILLWMAAIYGLNRELGFSRLTGFVTGVQLLVFIAIVFSNVTNGNDQYFYVLWLIYLAIGITLVLLKKLIQRVYVILGYLIHGLAALVLSFEDIWPVEWIYLPFSILYLMFVLYLIKKGSLLSIIILCVMVFRFYIDISFAYLPKSIVFIIGGLLLLGFGFYFEKRRKKGVNLYE